MSGPWLKLFKMAAKASGKKMGGTVKEQTAAYNQYLKEQAWAAHKGAFKTEHQKDIHDLATNDTGVAPSWVDKLIDTSTDPAHLKSIRDYLFDPERSYNLTRQMRGRLIEKAESKLELIQDQAILKSFVNMIREHGGDLF